MRANHAALAVFSYTAVMAFAAAPARAQGEADSMPPEPGVPAKITVEQGHHEHSHEGVPTFEVDSTPGQPYGSFAMSVCRDGDSCGGWDEGDVVAGLDGVRPGDILRVHVVAYGTTGPFAAAFWRIGTTAGLRYQGFEADPETFPMPDGGDGQNMGIASKGRCREGFVHMGAATFVYAGDATTPDSLWFENRTDMDKLGYVACVPKIQECPGAKALRSARINAGPKVLRLSDVEP